MGLITAFISGVVALVSNTSNATAIRAASQNQVEIARVNQQSGMDIINYLSAQKGADSLATSIMLTGAPKTNLSTYIGIGVAALAAVLVLKH